MPPLGVCAENECTSKSDMRPDILPFNASDTHWASSCGTKGTASEVDIRLPGRNSSSTGMSNISLPKFLRLLQCNAIGPRAILDSESFKSKSSTATSVSVIKIFPLSDSTYNPDRSFSAIRFKSMR